MKRLLWLFTLLICFSFVGFSKTTTDLAENSKQRTELFSFADVVKAEMVCSVSNDLKAVVGTGPLDKVPIYLQGPNTYNYNTTSLKSNSAKQDITICIRDKIRKY